MKNYTIQMNYLTQILHNNIKDVCAFLFCLMLWRDLPVKVTALLFGREFEYLCIGFLVLLCICIYSFYLFMHYQNLGIKKAHIIPFGGIIVFLTGFIHNYNEASWIYFTLYMRYVFFTLLFLIFTKNVDCLIRYYCRFSLISMLVLSWQPLSTSNVFANYMDYGFNCILPTAIGMYILGREKNQVIFYILFLVCLVFGFLFANRSTCICILSFVLFYNLLINKSKLYVIKFIILLGIVLSIVVLNANELLDVALLITQNLDYDAPYLYKIKLLLSETTMDVFLSGRITLYEYALNDFLQSPIIGNGMGYFEKQNNIYTHNVFLDFILNWGSIGGVLFLLIFVYIIFDLYCEKCIDIKRWKCIIFSLWFPKLFLSGSFTYELPFWATLTMLLLNIYKDKNVEKR